MEAWVSGALEVGKEKGKGGKGDRVRGLRRREGGWFRRVSGGRRFSRARRGN